MLIRGKHNLHVEGSCWRSMKAVLILTISMVTSCCRSASDGGCSIINACAIGGACPMVMGICAVPNFLWPNEGSRSQASAASSALLLIVHVATSAVAGTDSCSSTWSTRSIYSGHCGIHAVGPVGRLLAWVWMKTELVYQQAAALSKQPIIFNNITSPEMALPFHRTYPLQQK